MAWRFQPGEPLRQEFTRVALEEAHRARALLTSNDLPADQAIHQARRSFKRLRALVRLAKPSLADSYMRENRRWRDAGRLLSASRDAAVLLSTFDSVVGRAELPVTRAAALRECLGGAQPHPQTAVHGDEQVSEVLASLDGALRAIPKLNWPRSAGQLGRGLRDSQSRLRRTWKAAKRQDGDAGSEALHDWRKRVKDTGSHLGLLRCVLPPELKAAREDAKALARLLGEEHDLMLLRESLSEARIAKALRGSAAALLRCVDERRMELRVAALESGEGLSTRPAKELVQKVAAPWKSSGDTSPRQAAAQAGRSGVSG